MPELAMVLPASFLWKKGKPHERGLIGTDLGSVPGVACSKREKYRHQQRYLTVRLTPFNLPGRPLLPEPYSGLK